MEVEHRSLERQIWWAYKAFQTTKRKLLKFKHSLSIVQLGFKVYKRSSTEKKKTYIYIYVYTPQWANSSGFFLTFRLLEGFTAQLPWKYFTTAGQSSPFTGTWEILISNGLTNLIGKEISQLIFWNCNPSCCASFHTKLEPTDEPLEIAHQKLIGFDGAPITVNATMLTLQLTLQRFIYFHYMAHQHCLSLHPQWTHSPLRFDNNGGKFPQVFGVEHIYLLGNCNWRDYWSWKNPSHDCQTQRMQFW